jgi:hypothetical protein
MITVNLNGRTGNNLFQIAAALAVAKRNNTEAFYLGDDSYIKGFKLKGISKATKRAEYIFEERKFNFDDSFYTLGDKTHLEGYFQSEKNFIHAEDEVRRCFSFDHSVVENAKNYNNGKYKNILNGENATAIHVRRTDYLKYPNIYPEYTLDYYQNCLSTIQEKGKLLVFSDDLNWCINSFKGQNYDFIDMPPLPSMYLMSNCKNIVMANSTFSWWAAWLGKSENVRCPKNWFGKKWPHQEKHHSQEECTKDLFPKGWNLC